MKKPTPEQIAQARQTLEDAGYVLGSPFHTDDIVMYAKQHQGVDLSEEQASEIAENIKENFDASLGINWDVVHFAIDAVIQN